MDPLTIYTILQIASGISSSHSETKDVPPVNEPAIQRIHTGMTAKEVIAALGHPAIIHNFGTEFMTFYYRGKMCAKAKCWVILQNKSLVSIERFNPDYQDI